MVLAQIQAEEQRIANVYRQRAATGADARYSFFSAANLAMIQERERAVLSLLRRRGHSDLKLQKLLEVGCGRGFWLRQFIHWGMAPANITGLELLPEHADQARRVLPGATTVVQGSGASMPFPDASFDIVMQSVMFSSILDIETKQRVAREMMRVVRPGGAVLWYDFFVDNPRNRDVRGIGRREIEHLFSGCRIEMLRITLAPPLARAVTPLFSPLYNLLSSTRVLCTHYLGLITR